MIKKTLTKLSSAFLTTLCLTVSCAVTPEMIKAGAPALNQISSDGPSAYISNIETLGIDNSSNGYVQININWPEQSGFSIKTIPPETTKIKVKITASGEKDINYEINRYYGSAISNYRVMFMIIPAGTDRKIRVEAVDRNDKLLASGEKTEVSIQANKFNRISIVLTPADGVMPSQPPSNGGGGGGGGGGGNGNGPNPPVPPPPPANNAPSVTSITPSLSLSGGSYIGTISATATDPESNPLTYTWTASGGTLTTNNAATVNWSGSVGTYTFTVNVSDGTNAPVALSKTVTLVPPTINNIDTTNITENTLNVYSGNIEATINNPGNLPLTYAWTVTRTGLPGGSITSASTVNPITWQGGPGNYTANVTVSNANGSNTFAKSFTCVDNQKPVINTVSNTIAQTSGKFNGTLTINATDPESHALTYTWTDNNPAILQSTSGQTVTLKPDTIPGTYTLYAKANDGFQNSDPYTVTLNLTASAPTITEVTHDVIFTNPNYGGTITATATDPESDLLTYTWSKVSGPAGETLSASGNPASFSGPTGTYVIRVTAADPGHLTSIPYDITLNLNQKPVVTDITNPAFTFNSTTSLHTSTLTAVATDGDPTDISSLSYLWSTTGGTLSLSTGNPVTFSAPAGTYTVTAKANDGKILSDAYTKAFTLVNPNNKPVVTGVTPNLTYNAGNFTGTVTAAATDQDNNPLTYSWQVMSGGSNLNPTNQKTVNWTAAPGTHTIRVIANDGTDNSDPYDYTTTLTANQSPIVSGINVDYTTLYTYNGAPERHMTVNASDPEGQVLTYAWETVGSPAGTFYQLFPSNTPASNINPVAYRGSLGTVYNVKVTVSDGVNSTAYTKSIVLSNPPSVSSVNYSLSCNGSSYVIPLTLSVTDPDGHSPITTSWSVNKGTLSGNTGLNNTWTIPTAGTGRLTITTSDAYGSTVTNIDLTVSGCS